VPSSVEATVAVLHHCVCCFYSFFHHSERNTLCLTSL
jgi:hypothetical protein